MAGYPFGFRSGDGPRRLRLVSPPHSGPDSAALADRVLGKPYLAVYAPLLGHSAPMRAIREIVEQVAPINTTILFRGESGVGKDLVARAVHAASPRANGPFVRVNCAAQIGRASWRERGW